MGGRARSGTGLLPAELVGPEGGFAVVDDPWPRIEGLLKVCAKDGSDRDSDPPPVGLACVVIEGSQRGIRKEKQKK